MRAPARALLVVLPLWVLGSGVHAQAPAGSAAPDPIGVAVDQLQAKLAALPDDEEGKQLQQFAGPFLDQAERAVADGRRWVALARVAFFWTNIEAAAYRGGFSSELRGQLSALEREFELFGPQLAAFQGAARPDLGAAPAAARAAAEVALSQVAGFYDASLEYGKATAPEFGLYYIGAAKAQIELARFAASIRDASVRARPLAPRSVAPEITAVEDELLAAYRPPASVDQHPVFIRISALLKEARELDAAGLHHGALFKLLDAKLRLARLLAPERKLDAAATAARAAEAESRLAASGVDPTIAQTFVEMALVQVADPDPAQLGPETAAAVFEDVLPLYFRLLEPAPPVPSEQVAETTVTLIRWPYT